MIDTLISNCRVVTSGRSFDGWIGIDKGLISHVGSATAGLPPEARSVIDGRGMVAMPGRIDPHIHIGIHGADMSDDIEKVSRLAAVGGTTTLMPLNRVKRSYHEVFPEWGKAVAERAYTDFLFHLQIQIPEHVPEIGEYRRDYGVACLKLHFDYRYNDPFLTPMDIAQVHDGLLYSTMVEVGKHGGVVAVHCENTFIASEIARQVRESGGNDLLAWGRAKPPIVEAVDVDLVGGLATRLGVKAIAVHLSSEMGLRAAEKYSQKNLAVEAVAAHLTMTIEEAHERIGVAARGNPPLRSASDLEALWGGLRDGRIETIGSDNVLRETVGGSTIWETGVGHTSMEFILPLLMTHGVKAGRISLEQLSTILCDNPARLYGIEDRKRGIAIGGDADIVLIDMDEKRVVSGVDSQTGYRTVVDGLTLSGWPKLTMLRGEITYDGESVHRPRAETLRSTL